MNPIRLPDCQIHRVVAGEGSLFVASYIVEGPDAVVVVDTPMLTSDAAALARQVEALGKPLAGVLLTHPHPDHVNGTTELLAGRPVPVFAVAETDRVMRELDAPKRAFWTPIYGEDYPKVTTFPTNIVASGETIQLAGMNFTVHDIGPGESAAASIWLLDGPPKTAFVGDLVYIGVHAWLAESRGFAWMRQILHARPLLAGCAHLLIGHGDGGGPEILDEGLAYIAAYRAAIGRHAGGTGKISDTAAAAVAAEMTARYPGWRLPALLTMSAGPTAAELVD